MATKEEINNFIDERLEDFRLLQNKPDSAQLIEEELRELRDELADDYDVEPNKLDSYLNRVRQLFESELRPLAQFDLIKRLSFTLMVNDRPVPKTRIRDKKLAGNKIEITKIKDEKEFRRVLRGVVETIGISPQSTQQQILLENAKLLLEEASEASKYSREFVRPRRVRVDSFLGGLSLKRRENRKNIYNYWENVNDLYGEVEIRLSQLVTKANDFLFSESSSDELKEIGKELEKFVGEDLSYVLELGPASALIEDSLIVVKNYLSLVAVLWGVGDEYKKLRRGGEILDLFDDSKVRAPTAAEVSTLNLRSLGELASLTSNDEDDRIIDDNAERDLADPLLAYYFSTGKLVMYVESQYEKVSNYLNEFLESLREEMDGEDIVYLEDSVMQELKEASESFTDYRDKYYLPNSVLDDGVFKQLEDYKGLVKDNSTITDFLLTVGKMLWAIEPVFPSRSPKENISRKKEFYEVGQRVGRIKGEAQAREELNELLDAIDAYYITPSYSGRLTIGEVDFTKSRGAKLISTGRARLGVQNVTGQAYARLLDKTFVVPPRAINTIYKFLEKVMTGGALDRNLIRDGEKAADALAGIFANKNDGAYSLIEERNNNHIAAIIAYLFEEAGKQENADKEEALGEKKFKGKTLLEREKEYKKDYSKGKAFPLFALPSFLEMYQKDIARSPKTRESLGRLRVLLDEIEALPIVIKSLLKAHDVLRIMKNEGIVIAYRPRNIIHYDEVINKMYHEQNIDLSHSEVEKIVTEVDSFANIAKSMGISEEVVYQVKAQFR